MNSDPWWRHFDKDPREKIQRLVPGAFGYPVRVSLDRISWAYLDWVDTEYDTDSQSFFQRNHKEYDPQECSFDDWMEDAIRRLFLRMEKHGAARPPWCPKAQPWHFMDI